MSTKASAKSKAPPAAAVVDMEKVRAAAPELLAACEAMWKERFELSARGTDGTHFHSGWCGSQPTDPEPCKGTGKGVSPCALWTLRYALKKAGVPKG